MSIFGLVDSFQIIRRQAPVSVGAPHHGTRPNVDADQYTAPIALGLAASLDASVVVAHDLRRIVDVNKNPLRMSPHVRGYALRYQDALFEAGPRMLIEIHGQAGGRYEIEISTGFDLDPALPGDALFLTKLAVLKEMLPDLVGGCIGHRPSVGVYPLDRDVEKTATATFTFQKIRRARTLVGLEWYGLHIELNRDLRPGPSARSSSFVEALAHALATGIRAAFEPWPHVGATIPVRGQPLGGEAALLASLSLRVRPVPAHLAQETAVVVHPIDLERLGALDGDLVLMRHGDEVVRCTITPSRAVTPGQAALPTRLRHQIGLGRRGRLVVGRPTPLGLLPTPAPSAPLAVVREARPGRNQQVWLSPAEIQRLGLREGGMLYVQGQPLRPAINSTALAVDPTLPPRIATTSQGLLDRLGLTFGEVIALRPAS